MLPLTPLPALPISAPLLSSSRVTTFITTMAHKPPVSSFIGAAHPPVMPKHRMYPSVPCAHDFIASRVSNEPMKSSVPAAVLHVATTESLLYISPVSSSIHAKLDRNIRLHRRYPSNVCAQDFVQLKGRSKPSIIVTPQTSSLIVPQPCAATFVTPACSDSANECVLASPTPTYCNPDVLHNFAEVFDRFSATGASYADCNTPQPVPSLPALPTSPDHCDNTTRITSLSPTSLYSPHADLIESDEDISICSTPCTQPADHDPHC